MILEFGQLCDLLSYFEFFCNKKVAELTIKLISKLSNDRDSFLMVIAL